MGSLEDQTQESIPPAMGKQMFEAYRRMLVSLFIAALLVIAVIAALGFAMDIAAADGSEDGYQPPITLAVALAGVVGALFSALTRLYDVRDLPKALIHPELRHLGNKYLLMYSLVPVVMGLVASVVVYLAVLGGVINGALFPDISCIAGEGKCNSFMGLFDYGPTEAADYAKALVLGFVSGFSERLIRGVVGTVETSLK